MKKEETYRVGDIFVAEFVANHREGRKPVCLINGMVCFIDREYRGKFVQVRSVWHVEVLEIKDRVMVVNPVQEIKTATENNREIAARTELLKEKFQKVRPKKDRLRSTNLFLGKVEIQKG